MLAITAEAIGAWACSSSIRPNFEEQNLVIGKSKSQTSKGHTGFRQQFLTM